MFKRLMRIVVLLIFLAGFTHVVNAQKKKGAAAPRTAVKRQNTTVRKSTKGKTKTNVKQGGATEVVEPAAPAVVAAEPPKDSAKVNDSLPLINVKKSLRMDAAVDLSQIRDRAPLVYENLRADDAMYRHKIWREIDAREKINLPFRYSTNEDNGNQKFISILLKAIQDSAVEVFSNIDDRFTTLLTRADVVKVISGGTINTPIIDSLGNVTGYKEVANEVNLDSFYKFRIKEEVIFDKESSRLFWRILGIAPLHKLMTSTGIQIGTSEVPMFWIYYPDLRPTLAKYEVYNPKNYGQRMTWEELFESRMFSGRIVKSTMDNPFDYDINQTPGLKENGIFQLLEGERIKDNIFNYEQNLWSY